MQKQRILIDEDDTEVNIIYKEMLSSKYELKIVENANDALIELKKKIPDLMILDILLPPKGGDVFFLELREKPEFDNLKVLAITVLGENTDFFTKARNSSSLGKPFTKKALLEAIDEMLKR